MTGFTCVCQTGEPHVFPELDENVKHGLCILVDGERMMRITYQDNSTIDFPASIFLEGYMNKRQYSGVFDHYNIPFATRSFVNNPTEENIFKTQLLDACLQAYHESWHQPEPTMLLPREMVGNLNSLNIHDYVNLDNTTIEDTITMLGSRHVNYYSHGENRYATRIHDCQRAGENEYYFTPIPYELITRKDMGAMLGGLILGEDKTGVTLHHDMRTQYKKIIEPVAQWVRTTLNTCKVWGKYGFLNQKYAELSDTDTQTVNHAIYGYHKVHHALLVAGSMPTHKSIQTMIKPLVQEITGYVKNHKGFESYHSVSFVESIKPLVWRLVRTMLIVTGHYDTEAGVVFDQDITRAALKFVVDYTSTLTSFVYDEELDVVRVLDTQDIAERVAAGMFHAEVMNNIEVTTDLFDLPTHVVADVLEVSGESIYRINERFRHLGKTPQE